MKLQELETEVAKKLGYDCIWDCEKRMETDFIISLCHGIMNERIKELEDLIKDKK